MKDEIVAIAAKSIKVPVEEAKEHCREIPELNAYYFWNPVRGGIAVIVNENGEKLSAASSVSYERHKAAFEAGRRN